MFNEIKDYLEILEGESNLGHSAKNKAFIRQVSNMCHNPGSTGSGASPEIVDYVSAYRFAKNSECKLDKLREIQLKTSLELCKKDETILVINDVSLLDYNKHNTKTDRRNIGDGRGKGYEFVCNLGVSLESETILGVLHSCLINADGPDDSEVVDYHGNPLFKELSEENPERLERNHKHMLACHFKHLSKTLSDRNVIVVADREFDDHFIFEECIKEDQDFVIRSNALRNVQVSDDYDWLPEENKTKKYSGLPLLPNHSCVGMKALIDNVPLKYYKKIPLDGKGRHTDEQMAKSHAELSIGSFSVVLYRNAKRNSTYITPNDYCKINVVVVKELNPPKDRDAICWVIYTSLPVDSFEGICKIARIYELRWIIECFFKYLKSGFKLEDIRYNNAKKIGVHIVIISLAITFIMRLKAKMGLPYSSYLSEDDYKKIKHASKNLDDENIEFELRLFAHIAKKGGWLGRKGDPISPMTLMRGLNSLMTALDIIEEAPFLINELLKRRKIEKKRV